jgi:predicted nucleic acid-binding protein
MRVVSNTSPLSNLAIIGHLGLVREQLGTLLIPPGMRAELLRNPHPRARSAIKAAIQEGWIRVIPLAGTVSPIFAAGLDLGEAEALALALETRSPFVLLDESAARLQAKQLGLSFTGVLGLLRQAKRTGRIPSLKEQINRLRTEARFFISSALEKALIISVGED